MKTIREYLDLAKLKTGSDYATAKAIGMTRAGVSNARKNDIMSSKYAVRLAGLLNIDPKEIVAAADIKENPENAKIWSKWVAASVILSCFLMGSFSYNSKGYAKILMQPNYTLCAMQDRAGKPPGRAL